MSKPTPAAKRAAAIAAVETMRASIATVPWHTPTEEEVRATGASPPAKAMKGVRKASPRKTKAATATPKTAGRGRRTPEELRAIAAAEMVAKEIALVVEDLKGDVLPWALKTTAMSSQLASQTKAGWRQLIYPQGQELVWHGDVRASATGKILFGMTPISSAATPFVEERGVTLVEVPHDALDEVVRGFSQSLRNHLGADLETFLKQAAQALTAEELSAASSKPDEVEASPAIDQIIPGWGRWA